MLKTVVDAGVPVLVFFAEVVVGMEQTASDFRRVNFHRQRVAAVQTTPLALAVLQTQIEESTGFPVPFGVPAGQLFVLPVLAVLTGMDIRL